jgi:hypothetical protein
VNFLEISLELKRMRIPQRDEDDSMMEKGREDRDCGGLLTSTLGAGGDEYSGVFSCEFSGRPELARGIQEGLCADVSALDGSVGRARGATNLPLGRN